MIQSTGEMESEARGLVLRASELMRQLANTEAVGSRCSKEQEALWTEAQRCRIEAKRIRSRIDELEIERLKRKAR